MTQGPAEPPARPASSPCMADALDEAGRLRVDAVQQRDVARWRRVERERLIALRTAMPAAEREGLTAGITAQLEALIGSLTDPVVSAYWPIRGEPDLRDWMTRMHGAGVRFALPVVVARATPLEFRRWTPGCRMEPGVWRIPQPAERELLTPTLAIAPLVGYDSGCYRLGYGGGFFDRTLAALAPRALAVGIGYPQLAVPTIFPQPFDVPMDWILTGSLAPVARARVR
jgi:5-formyltetrahydrofolate cyclo-ligase